VSDWLVAEFISSFAIGFSRKPRYGLRFTPHAEQHPGDASDNSYSVRSLSGDAWAGRAVDYFVNNHAMPSTLAGAWFFWSRRIALCGNVAAFFIARSHARPPACEQLLPRARSPAHDAALSFNFSYKR
jgi:hypothetical protein